MAVHTKDTRPRATTKQARGFINVICLTEHEAEVLRRPVVGDGGLQRLFREIVATYSPAARAVELTDAQIGRVWRMMAYARGAGGFQGRLRQVFARPFCDPLWLDAKQRFLPMPTASTRNDRPAPAVSLFDEAGAAGL